MCGKFSLFCDKKLEKNLDKHRFLVLKKIQQKILNFQNIFFVK